MIQKNDEIESQKKNLKVDKSKSSNIKEQDKKASNILSNSKSSVKETKENVRDKIGNIKEEASNRNQSIKENIGEINEEAKKEGVTPAEKVVGDIVSKLKYGAGQINDTISEYTKENSTRKIQKKPLVDVLETDEKIIIIADISNVNKDNINVKINKESVEIEVNYKKEPDIEGASFIQRERSYGHKFRRISLKSEINIKNSTAKYQDSTLTITLPKNITKLNIN